MFHRKCQVQKWCEQTGVHFRHADGPYFRVLQSCDIEGEFTHITVTHQKNHSWTKFLCNLPIRFPLGRTPDGLFARAMIRSLSLGYANWHVELAQSCEASLYLCGNVPTKWITPALFAAICREIGDEARAFHQEICDKFNYAGQGGDGMAFGEVRHHAVTGLPMLRSDNLPQRFRG